MALELLALLVAGTGMLALGARSVARRRTMYRPIASENSAFEESVIIPPDAAQLERLRPLIDRIGVLSSQPKFQGGSELYNVFLIDRNGAVHNVTETWGLAQAQSVVGEFEKCLSVPVEDPEGLLD